MPPPLLHHQIITAPDAQPKQCLVVLHGIFGAGRNWATVMKRLVALRPDWSALLVDLRGHNRSTGFAPPHSVQIAAHDVAQLVQTLQPTPWAILGHSFGGKVALHTATSAPTPPTQVWLVDATPQTATPAGTPWKILEAVRELPNQFDSRDDALNQLLDRGIPTRAAHWLTANLTHTDSHYTWPFEPDTVTDLLTDYYNADLWHVIDDPANPFDTHVIKAQDSTILTDNACQHIEHASAQTGRAHLHHVAGEHWVNTDNPDALVALLDEHLPKLTG